MDVIASSSEMSDLIQRIYKACVAARTRKFQSWVLYSKCLQLSGYVLAWKTGVSRDEFLERAGQAMVEMLNCFRRALKLVSECGCEWWLQQALVRQHGEREFVQLVDDLEVCVDVIVSEVLGPNEIIERQVSADRCFIRDELREAAERDKADLVEYLHGHEGDLLCENLFHRLENSELDDDRGFEPLQVEDGDIRWKDGVRLGMGASGTVYKGCWKDLPVAVKVFNADDTTIEKELEVMSYLVRPHPHVLQIFCYSKSPKEQVIAMELMKMDLKKFLEKRKLSLVTSVDILLQVARGTRHMHSQRVVHRDLKPQNVLVDFDSDEVPQGEFQGRVNVLLNDFGIAKTGFDTMVDEPFTHMRGTPRYMAPEMLADYHITDRYSRKVDVYSFAVLCSEVLTGSPPFGRGTLDIPTLKSMLSAGRRPRLPDNCPDELLDLINKCWSTNADERPTFDVIEQELFQLKKQLLAPKSSSTHQSSCNNTHSSSSGSSSSLGPATVAAASIQELRITGSAEVGGRLNVKFRPINGTKFCICRWTRRGSSADYVHKPVIVMMTSAATTEFQELSLSLTAEDYKRKLVLECLPLNAELKAGSPVKASSGTVRNTQGEEQIRRNWNSGQASFKVERLRGRFWDSTGTLYVNRKDYLLWWGQGNPKNLRFSFADAGPNDTVPIELSREDPLVCNLKKNDGSLYPVKFTSSASRDNALLTMMYFWERRDRPR